MKSDNTIGFFLAATFLLFWTVGISLISSAAFEEYQLSDKETAVIDCMRNGGRPAFDARFKFIGCATR